MDFTIVLVSRGRPTLLANLLLSIARTAKTDYEVLIGCDSDDLITYNSYQSELHKFENVRFFFKERNPNLHEYINYLVSQGTGKYVFGLNDDCELVNELWDKKALEALDKFGPLCYGVTQDNSIDKVGPADYASFPIISRAAINRLGFFMEQGFGNHGSDVVTHRIYSNAGLTCQVPVYIRHIYHETPALLQSRMSDTTAREMIERTMKENNLGNLYTYDISSYVEKLCTK